MSKIWVTSDLHFNHKVVCEYTDRKLVTTAEEHSEWLIDLWNSQVSKNDVVIECGDFVFNCRKLDVWQSVVNKLNGKIIHIAGNHDSHDVLKASGHEWYDLKTKTFSVNGVKQQFVFCHYSMRVWQNSHHGSIHCFGHSHGNLKEQNGKSLDVGLDSSYNIFGEHKFFTLEEIVELMSQQSVALHDHHTEKTDK